MSLFRPWRWLQSLPVQTAQSAALPLGWLDAVGAALVAVGIATEATGDFQLARFKADPANKGRVMDRGDAVGLKIAQDKGNNIIKLDEAETQRWKDAAAPVVDGWIKEVSAKGLDGKALVDEDKALIAKESGM